ncbi:MAG: hypothetical protein WBE26_12025 [Phycisphaerae bacterium]
MAKPTAAGTGRAAIRVLPGLCDKVRQVARFIAVVGLDTPVRSIVNECLPFDHSDIAEFDGNASLASTAHVDLLIFCTPKDLEQTQALCATLRSHVSQSAPLLCRAGRYVYPLIGQLLVNAVQSMIMMPFDARELRQKLDELDLGF